MILEYVNKHLIFLQVQKSYAAYKIFQAWLGGWKNAVPCIGFLYFLGTRQLSYQQIYKVNRLREL